MATIRTTGRRPSWSCADAYAAIQLEDVEHRRLLPRSHARPPCGSCSSWPRVVSRSHRSQGDPAGDALRLNALRLYRTRLSQGDPASIATSRSSASLYRTRLSQGDPAYVLLWSPVPKLYRTRLSQGDPAIATARQHAETLYRTRLSQGDPAFDEAVARHRGCTGPVSLRVIQP